MDDRPATLGYATATPAGRVWDLFVASLFVSPLGIVLILVASSGNELQAGWFKWSVLAGAAAVCVLMGLGFWRGTEWRRARWFAVGLGLVYLGLAGVYAGGGDEWLLRYRREAGNREHCRRIFGMYDQLFRYNASIDRFHNGRRYADSMSLSIGGEWAYDFFCPSAWNSLPMPHYKTPQANFILPRMDSDYVYCGKGRIVNPPERFIVVIERPGHHPSGGHVLWSHGAVEWKTNAELNAIISAVGAGENPPRGILVPPK